MPASFSVDDPAHWRGRAEEARTVADEMKDEISRQMMLDIAETYERLAKHAEERAKKRRVRPWEPRRPFTKTPGAQFEISIDGTPRTYRDRKTFAIEAAEHLKRKHPNNDIVVKDLQSGEATKIKYKPDLGPRWHSHEPMESHDAAETETAAST